MVGENAGIRVPPQSLKQTVRGIAAAILELSADASLREALGKNARERVLCEFTWEKKADRLVQVYEEAIGRKSA
jgi:glycosyltransferase involved in cell wall biosynthesis